VLEVSGEGPQGMEGQAAPGQARRAPGGGGKKKVGRNDPCPCGKKDPVTGKPIKYKKCCYPKFG